MVTLTFARNVEDMHDAKKCWRVLKERIRRRFPDVMMAGAWQRQGRGAWHYHGVVNQFIDVNWLRPVAMECGFGQQMKLRRVIIEQKSSSSSSMVLCEFSWSLARTVNYITRYVSRDALDESVEAGVRVVDYFGRCRVATTAFAWSGGFARLWRAGREAWYHFYHEAPRWDDYHSVVQMGWHALTEDEQARVMEESDAVFKWRCPDLVPY